jgi:2-oxoglutarate dehydrogenase complex dehydrogenase (E1) component-like enzyme
VHPVRPVADLPPAASPGPAQAAQAAGDHHAEVLLRHKDAVSSLEDLSKGTFETVIGEVDELDVNKVKRVVVCSGKIYYELLAHRRANDIKDIAIIRLEPTVPGRGLRKAEVNKYPNAKEVVWCQEEPRNQGVWYWLASRHHLDSALGDKHKFLLVSRPAALAGRGLLRQAQRATEGRHRERIRRNQSLMSKLVPN